MRSTTKRPELRPTAIAGGAIALGGLVALHLLVRDGPGQAPAARAVRPASPPASQRADLPAAPRPGAAAPAAEGLRLYGLLGGGAIIGVADGRQRWVAVGREVVPGLRLHEVRQHQAVLVSAGGMVELSLDGSAAPAAGRPSAAPASPPSGRARDEETLHYRFGLAPQRDGERIIGFAVRPEADLPMLRRAGLQAGDVLVSVNGQSFDSQERVQELATEIAGSFTAEFEFLRGGQRMRRSLEVNPRR
ncbi:MAG TPA: PDZ domain-containing protein [Allosphingosinicella sp.]|nr:PDZ domain-containing protein [Allosphingosinicella sp.]